MRAFNCIAILTTGALMSLYPLAQGTADRIFVNGKILTVDAAFSIHSAMAVKGDRILAVGERNQLEALKGPNTQIVDLGGKTVMPGLIDSHTHPAAAAAFEFDHDVPQMDSIQEVLNYISSRTKVVPEGQWIWVSQVFLTRLKEQRYPTLQELDQVAPRHPVVFRTGPDASVNTLALKMAGIDENWKVTDGGPGYAEKDPATGKLTGILRSCTRFLKDPKERTPSPAEHAQLLRRLFDDYNRVGITMVGERDASPDEAALYQGLHDRGELTCRTYLVMHIETIPPIEEIRQKISRIAASPLYKGDSMLRARAAKAYLDGGMLTGSAYMLKPWGVSELYGIRDPQYRGMQFIPDDKLAQILEACFQADVQFTAHTVGDGAVQAFVNACAKLADRFDVRAKRPVIGHSNFMTPQSVDQVAEMGIPVDIQPAWLYLDGRTLDGHFGDERLAWFQPLRALFAKGAIAGGGSDHMQKIGSMRSINFYDPWMGMWVAMTRTARWLDHPLHPEHALSRVEAIRYYTINNAYILFSENELGSLEPGKLADFIVLDRDIMTCPLDEFPKTQVVATYLGGKELSRRAN